MTHIGRVLVAAVVSLSTLGASGAATAEPWDPSRTEVSLMGGVQWLNQNDTAFSDDFLNIPAVATATYRLTPVFSVEGELTWMIPVEQSANVGSATVQDLKTPDVLAYQANLRADLPIASGAWRPYVAAGAGGVTFLSNTDPNTQPALDESQTAFAMNFGAGFTYRLTDNWSIRADAREFVAFPSEDAAGLSASGSADEIWMDRGTIGLSYGF